MNDFKQLLLEKLNETKKCLNDKQANLVQQANDKVELIKQAKNDLVENLKLQEDILSVFSQFVEEIVDEYEDNKMVVEEYTDLIYAIDKELDGESTIYCENCGCVIEDKDQMVERDGNYFCSVDCKTEYYGCYCDYCDAFIEEGEEIVQGANGEVFCSDYCAEHYNNEEEEEE